MHFFRSSQTLFHAILVLKIFDEFSLDAEFVCNKKYVQLQYVEK